MSSHDITYCKSAMCEKKEKCVRWHGHIKPETKYVKVSDFSYNEDGLIIKRCAKYSGKRKDKVTI